MPGISRVGDLGAGFCPCHDGTVSYLTQILTGAKTVNTNGEPTALIGSIGQASCGHMTQQLTGAKTVFAEGAAVARVGDLGQTGCGGPYEMITGSPNVINTN